MIRFRQGSVLALAITAFLLLLWEGVPSEAQTEETAPVETEVMNTDPVESVQQATTTLHDLLFSFYAFLPKLVIAVLLLFCGWGISRLIRSLTRRHLRGTHQKSATLVTLAQIAVNFIFFVVAVSVLAGDIRALLGSLGLVGLALSWALQTPIESFTGWVLNTFRGYYRIGDRIEVGEVFGDVYKIDVLTTTVWEAGGPGKPVAGAQPTGALITFPNSEILRSNVINYSKNFPFVWDEVTFGLANESDLTYALNVIRRKSEEVLGDQMARSIRDYRRLLESQGLDNDIEEKPQVYLSLTDSWTNCTVRYLVGVRQKRKWSSLLIEEISRELSSEQHRDRIHSAYPRQETLLRLDDPEESPERHRRSI